MTKTFKELPLKQQVEFINKELKNSNISLKKVCQKFGLNKKKINDKFYNAGYEYNPKDRAYTKVVLIQKSNKSISNIEHKGIELSKPVEGNLNILEPNRLKNIENALKEVKELIEIKEDLKEVIQKYNKDKNVIDVVGKQELRFDFSKFKGEVKGRYVKVYENINKDWIKFCKKNKQFNIQDLYSLALLEFMDKYN
ncbi:DUF4250 domain-containing protein [Clostridium botulinum]|nr:DUF4250 domain-containing protein [Clostridium botulinum]NFA17664.1 DUF4250 domain-containing protein [Clostridium botulinum]NFA54318.1 DUF4250 domain-containing protein [Clostridium botulinum]NFA67866.1 DUF4250 domain-containing protein [Clostridium botulinum]NFE17000.1 DUF4250 domain-containing protein [Clostridium botulinum]